MAKNIVQFWKSSPSFLAFVNKGAVMAACPLATPLFHPFSRQDTNTYTHTHVSVSGRLQFSLMLHLGEEFVEVQVQSRGETCGNGT